MKKIELLHGDCLELMKSISDKSIDLVLTDPPYGTTACKWDTVIPFEPMWKELKRVRKDNVAIVLFGSEPFSSHLRMSNINEFKYDWIWHKSKPSGISTAKYMPMKSHEILSVFGFGKLKFYPIKENRAESSIKRLKQGKFETYNTSKGLQHLLGKTEKKQVEEFRNPTSVKFFASKSNNKENHHPTQKPVPLLEYLIKTYTLEGEMVLDFTMGSGSTGVAAKNLNRNFIGIEKDLTYYDIATKRIYESLVVKG